MRTGATARTKGRAPARAAGGPLDIARRGAALGLAVAARRPLHVLGAVAVTACVTSVVWNATHQTGRHPAPLFAKAAGAPPAETPRWSDLPAPLPVPRPDPAQLQTPPAAEPPRAADPIGALIRGETGSIARAEPRPAADPKPVDPAKLVSAQKALVKLGYGPLKADGLVGATTRQAIERFERDRNLPVTGAVAGRTARQLAALSGYPVE